MLFLLFERIQILGLGGELFIDLTLIERVLSSSFIISKSMRSLIRQIYDHLVFSLISGLYILKVEILIVIFCFIFDVSPVFQPLMPFLLIFPVKVLLKLEYHFLYGNIPQKILQRLPCRLFIPNPSY